MEGDTIITDPVQYQAILNLNYFIPTFKKQSLGLFLKLGAIFNAHIFQNEMFRLGGLTTIRGFNEESIFASSYGIGTVEYRYLYEKNANIRLFSDIGLIKNQNYSMLYIPDLYVYDERKNSIKKLVRANFYSGMYRTIGFFDEKERSLTRKPGVT